MRFIICCVSFLWVAAASAETTTFNCSFPTFSDERGGPQKPDGGFRMTFLVDSTADKAYVIGNNGSNEVIMVQNKGGFTLIEVTGTGNVMVTAITISGKAVHSRHSIVSKNEIIPSQYYGQCKAQ